ncbi:hypothetical protein ACP70R_017671 [Stipagrostis hirtigluma subsp. patula]
MGLQGDKATHDFLSLYTAAKKDSALPLLQESKKSPPPSQGFFLKTHDFLQPLERASSPSPPPADDAKQAQHRHPLPGGVGAFTITDAAAAVKQEPPFALWAQAADPRGNAAATLAVSCPLVVGAGRTRS